MGAVVPWKSQPPIHLISSPLYPHQSSCCSSDPQPRLDSSSGRVPEHRLCLGSCAFLWPFLTSCEAQHGWDSPNAFATSAWHPVDHAAMPTSHCSVPMWTYLPALIPLHRPAKGAVSSSGQARLCCVNKNTRKPAASPRCDQLLPTPLCRPWSDFQGRSLGQQAGDAGCLIWGSSSAWGLHITLKVTTQRSSAF